MYDAPPPLVSVIILNYNGGLYNLNCIRSVLGSSYSLFEVIFVDNASRDGSREQVEAEFGTRITIVKNSRNYGYGYANNLAARVAKGKYIVFLHNDTVVDSEWLSEAVKVLEADPSIGGAQSLMRAMGDNQPGLMGGLIDYYLLHLPPLLLKSSDKTPHEIVFPVGVSCVVRQSVLSKVGFFDADYFLPLEDLDLGWRIWLCGYRVVGIPSSVVYHKGGVGGDQLGSVVNYLHYRNTLVTMIKNYETKNVFWFVPMSVFLYAAFAVGGFAASGDQKFFGKRIVCLREVLWILLKLKHIWRKRSFVQAQVRGVKGDETFRRVAESNGLPKAIVSLPVPERIRSKFYRYF